MTVPAFGTTSNSTLPVVPGDTPSAQSPDRLDAGDARLIEALVDSYESYQSASFLLAPYNPDAFIASRGYQLLDDMLAMGAIRGPLNVIRDAVLYKGWRVTPAVNDKASADYEQAAKIADEFAWCLDNIADPWGNVYDFRQDLWEILYAIHTGFSVSEIVWRVIDEGPYAGKLGFAMLSHKPCKQIGFDLDLKTLAVKAITSYTPLSGYEFAIPVDKVVRYTFSPRAGLPYGQGVGRAAYKHSWTLDFLYKFWNIALETFGSPFILGKAPAHQMALAQKVITAIRQGAAPVLPAGVEADLIEIAGGGLQGFKLAAEHHTQQAGTLYLGASLTSGEGQRSGSLALGQVHQAQQEYGLSGRRTDIEKIIYYQLARRWTRYNYGPGALALTPRLSLGDWDAGDMQALSTAFGSLITSQVLHPAEDQIRLRLGLEPISPELREIMNRMWNDPSPSQLPAIYGGGQEATDPADPENPGDNQDDPPADDTDD